MCTGQVTSSIAVQGNTHIYIYYTKRLTQNHIHVFGISNIYIKRKSKDIATAGISNLNAKRHLIYFEIQNK